MEDIIASTFVEQVRLRNISIRSIHLKISALCAKDPTLHWFSQSTLERRFRNPEKFRPLEIDVLRLALAELLPESVFFESQSKLSERKKKRIRTKTDQALSLNHALPHGVDSDLPETDIAFDQEISAFYSSAPEPARRFWSKHLSTYLDMLNVAKAAVLCASSVENRKNEESLQNERLKDFLNFFPFYDSCMLSARFDDRKIKTLGKILLTAADASQNEAYEPLRELAFNKQVFDRYRSEIVVSPFLQTARQYRKSTTDRSLSAADFAHTASFILFIGKTEWILGYATSVFFYKQKKETASIHHEQSGFKFTKKEMEFLCELVSFMNDP